MKKKQHEETFSKRTKIGEIEESSESEEQQNTPPVREQGTIRNIYPFSLITSAFSLLLRLLGSSNASRFARSQSTQQQEEESAQGDNEERQQQIPQQLLQDIIRNRSQEIILGEIPQERDNTNSSEQGESQQEQQENMNVDEEMQRGLLSLVQSILVNLAQQRERESGRDTETEIESEPEQDENNARRIPWIRDFDLLFQQIPFSHRQDPNSIIFTIIYYVGDNSSRRKVIAEEELNKESPEELAKEASKECTVCLQNIEKGELIRTLPCKHFFHSACVSEWLTKYADECPLCRKSVITHIDAPNAEEQ